MIPIRNFIWIGLSLFSPIHCIFETRIAATQNDALIRDGVHPTEVLEMGSTVQLLTKSATAGEGEVWTATAPASGSLLGIYMVSEPMIPEIATADGNRYRIGSPDPRNFSIPALRPFSAFKPQPGDLILASEDLFANAKSTNTFANVSDGVYQLTWGGSQTASALSFKYVETKYISIGSGVLGGSQRVTAYLMECLAN